MRRLDERMSELESEFVELEEYVYEWNEAIETYVYAFRRIVEEKLDASFESYLELVEGDAESEEPPSE